MVIYLSEFTAFPVTLEKAGKPEDYTVKHDSVVGLDAVNCSLNIQESGVEYFCQGTVKAEVRLECARCLREYTDSIENYTDFIICGEEYRKQAAAEAVDNESYVILSGSDQAADLTDIISEAIVLELSLKPLCSEGCRGLCSQCGVNLNESECSCVKEEIDPRWEQLKKLTENNN